MWRRRSWFGLKGKAGIPGQERSRPATSARPRAPPAGSVQQRDTGPSRVIGNDDEILFSLTDRLIDQARRRAHGHEPPDHDARTIGNSSDSLGYLNCLPHLFPLGVIRLLAESGASLVEVRGLSDLTTAAGGPASSARLRRSGCPSCQASALILGPRSQGGLTPPLRRPPCPRP